mgnify:CR=1 FL=1
MLLVSMGLRYIVNLHALNNEGSAGALTRVRRVPYIFIRKNGYKVREVNVVSGQSIAHAIQEHLVELSVKAGLNVCENCKRYVFVKQGGEEYLSDSVKKVLSEIKDKLSKVSLKDKISLLEKAEKAILSNCVVEDVGGFMIAIKNYPNIRRESSFKVSFLAPIMDEEFSENVYIESLQFARHEPATAVKKEEQEATEAAKKEEQEATERKEASAQMIFVQEVAGGVYGIKLDLEVSKIGRASISGFKKVLEDEEIKKRVDITIEAIRRTLGWFQFGAKRSRFNPIEVLVEAVIVVSDGMSVASPFVGDFYKETLKRAEAYKKIGGFVEVFHYKLGGEKSFDEVLNEAKRLILKKLEEELKAS